MQASRGGGGIKTVFFFLLVGLLVGFFGGLYVDTLRLEKPTDVTATSSPPFPAEGPFPSFADLVDSASSAVVNISTTKVVKSQNFFEDFYSPFKEFFGDDFWDHFFGQQPRERTERSLGSGFIVAEEGYIVTNAHVIEGAEEISIRFSSGQTVSAGIVGVDKKTDLALIKAESWQELPAPVKLGDSDGLRVGDWVIAIGNPFGLDRTVTAGIVSAKGRVIGAGPYDDFIQTDASINPGNSGGPLFNIRGEVVGINTSLLTTSGGNIGIGFAVPINMARTIIEQLKEQGEVVRGWFGVSVQELTPELAKSFGMKDAAGVLVAHVARGSPAAEAGIQNGDIIIRINKKKVTRIKDVPQIISDIPIGSAFDITVVRGGKEKTLHALMGEEKKDARGTLNETGAQFGIHVKEFSPEAAEQWKYTGIKEGVVVQRVIPGSQADEVGIQPGDLIVEIDRKPVKTLRDYHNVLESASIKDRILLLIHRGKTSFYVAVKEEGTVVKPESEPEP